MKRSLIQAMSLSLAIDFCPGLAQPQPCRPDVATIKKIESKMNSGAFPTSGYVHPPLFSAYARYYAAETKHHHHFVYGEFLEHEVARKDAGVYIVGSKKDFPEIFDGGCLIINMVYDVEAGKILSVICNGEA
jgi:hypothetical protein